jgi:aspartyl aminopeptidase
MKQTIKSLLSFIKTSPSPYHTVLSSKAILEKSGFTELKEEKDWNPMANILSPFLIPVSLRSEQGKKERGA